ncbi:hypothetical protein NL676_012187 [Syzygium grande]|nr:hypothetical protein NL676_012187 [Syzygium grande]
MKPRSLEEEDLNGVARAGRPQVRLAGASWDWSDLGEARRNRPDTDDPCDPGSSGASPGLDDLRSRLQALQGTGDLGITGRRPFHGNWATSDTGAGFSQPSR